MTQLQTIQLEQIVNALFWQLYIPVEKTGENYGKIWSNFVLTHPQQARLIYDRIVDFWAIAWKSAFAARLGIEIEGIADPQSIDLLHQQWKDEFLVQLNSQDIVELQRAIAQIVRESILPIPGENLAREGSTSPVREEETTSLPLKGNWEVRFSQFANRLKKNLNVPPEKAVATWHYHPVPEDERDRHDEYFAKTATSPPGYQPIGARVRGKKHKHEGTNCDDWFEFASSGDWTIIAVADGAGSKAFSRVGAKVSCEAAVQHLAEALGGHHLEKREIWSVETFDRDEATGAFTAVDLEAVQQALHKAMEVAYVAVEEAVQARSPYTFYYKALNHREIEISDLSATLLLAVHSTVKYRDTDYSLIMTCQVGDGTIAALDTTGKVQLLATPDSGEFAGQTEFLTSPGKLNRDNLMRKTFPFFRPLQALMVMTDGVADDYFPYTTGMLELYGDLCLNRAIDFPQPNLGEICDRISETQLGTLSEIEAAIPNLRSQVQRLTDPEDEVQQVEIYSLRNYAKSLGLSMAEVVASPELLAAVHLSAESCERLPEENLRLWLDSYQVRGSFDDRTLAILARHGYTDYWQ